MKVQCANVLTINENLSLLELVKAGNELCKARLSSSGMPDKSYCLASMDRQVEIGEHALAFIIAKGDIPEFNFAAQSRHRSFLYLMYAWFGVEQRKYTFACCQSQLELTPERCHACER